MFLSSIKLEAVLNMNTITLEIPDEMLQKLQGQDQSLQDMLLEAINEYLERKILINSKTWELCGSFSVQSNLAQLSSQQSTNYAENHNQDLY